MKETERLIWEKKQRSRGEDADIVPGSIRSRLQNLQRNQTTSDLIWRNPQDLFALLLEMIELEEFEDEYLYSLG